MCNVIAFSSIFSDFLVSEKVMKMARNKEDSLVYIIPAFTRFNNISEWGVFEELVEMGFKKENIRAFDVCFLFDSNVSLDDADVIVLGGGNTWLFRWLLKKHNMFQVIQKFVKNGGLLIGESAGSIMMSETIEIAKFADENIVFDCESDGLSLIDVDIKPHFQSWYNKMGDFVKFSIGSGKDLYCLEDGMGLVFNDGKVEYLGDIPIILNNGNIKNYEELEMV